jgi:hypothetical protein
MQFGARIDAIVLHIIHIPSLARSGRLAELISTIATGKINVTSFRQKRTEADYKCN